MNFLVVWLVIIILSLTIGVAADLATPDSTLIDVSVTNDFHSFTKAIVICDMWGNCVAQDFYVICEGKYITNITAIGTGVRVGADAKGMEDWC